ncbi:heterokaryon incompatibility protein-domain-containing protein [Boeremia exigua]|uniref:heterokaryon incompatibility protein-domain-containing protein n=1 Tax=Boeremia exigua TaxID=749465 RepID=UPI001E8DC532|nr:heterokaryon incompatibility protein-domain-containing protein [Boeremia exigua]KAH6633011.1 heterokaryon incompatibility protein-domain-containing protein [Boeremia exigua]
MNYPTTYLPRLGHLSFLELDQEELDTSSLQAKLIQPPTRQYLLSRRRPWAAATRDEIDADMLLADLGQLAPSAAKDFMPKAHTEASFIFRLINDVDYHGEENGYVAISYCWKGINRDTPRKVVEELPFAWSREIEHFPLPTSGALFQAVLKEKNPSEGLWFDQVCINRDDDAERAATIGAIDRIYSNARVVVVALDDIVASPAEEQFLRYYLEQYSYCDLPAGHQPNVRQNPPFMYHYPVFVSFVERVLGSEWFERAWCAYEMRLGQQHVFLLRCSSQYASEVQTVMRFATPFLLHMLVLASELPTFTTTQQTKMRRLQDALIGHTSIQAKDLAVRRPDTPQSPTAEPSQLVPTIVEVFQMKAGGNPQLPEYLRRLDANRDKTCIALSAGKLPITLAPANPYQRPNIEDECLRSLLLVGLAARDPVCLCTTGTPLQLHDGSVSWLSRPTSLDTHFTRSIPRRFPRSSNPIRQSSDGRAEYAELDLVFLDLPHRSNPNPLFPTHVARAQVFVQLCIQFHIRGPGMWDFWQTPDHPRSASMRNVFIQILACIFDCGPQWLLELTASSNFSHISTLDPNTIDMLLNPNLIIQNYILLPEGQSALSSLLACISGILVSGISWASGATECTHGPLIVSAPAPSYLAVDPSYGGMAIVFAPFAHSKTLLVAVPDAVKPAEYEGLSRAWVLTSMNPFTGSPKQSVNWTLQSKGVVFGDGNFNAALARSGETRCHRVYGPCVQMGSQ